MKYQSEILWNYQVQVSCHFKCFASSQRIPSTSDSLAVEQQEELDPDSTLFVGAVTTEVQIQNEECYVMLPVKGHITKLKIDTGSQVNIMPFKDLKKIVGRDPQINARTHNLVSYSKDKLTVLGMATLPVKSKTDA